MSNMETDNRQPTTDNYMKDIDKMRKSFRFALAVQILENNTRDFPGLLTLWPKHWDYAERQGLTDERCRTTPEGREAIQKFIETLLERKDGAPFNLYEPIKRKPATIFKQISVGEFDGRQYYTDGYLLLKGERPDGFLEPKGGKVNVEIILTRFDPGQATTIFPAAFQERLTLIPLDFARDVVFSRGIAVQGVYYDWIVSQHPNAEFRSDPERPRDQIEIYDNSELVGAVMPFYLELGSGTERLVATANRSEVSV